MDINKVLTLLPHRYPFLLIDRVLDFEKDTRLLALKNVTYNEHFFSGHFPIRPVMPGVLIVEAMAQTAAALVMHSLGWPPERLAKSVVYFMSIESSRFRRPVTPGVVMYLPVNRIQSRGRVYRFQGAARVEGTVVAEARYTAMIADV